MNTFFNGISEFKSRLATNFVAASEQVQEIAQLREIVNRLQASVDALTHTVNSLREERNAAVAERDLAIANEHAAIQLAHDYELERDKAQSNLHQALETIGTLTETKHHLERANTELLAQNDRQTVTLQNAINESQRLQEIITDLRNEAGLHIAASDNLRQHNIQLSQEVKKLMNMLVGAKAVLDGLPPCDQSRAA